MEPSPQFDLSRPDARFLRTYYNKSGHLVTTRPATHSDYDAVLYMYDRFEPKESAQGLPPRHPARRRGWVDEILSHNINVLTICRGEVIGHACLVDIQPGKTAELEIGVHQDHQNLGIGTEMTKLLLDLAREMNYHKVWLTVEATNFRAVHVYQKVGFAFSSPFGVEREMEADLTRPPVNDED